MGPAIGAGQARMGAGERLGEALARFRLPQGPARRAIVAIRLAALVALLVVAFSTPGFTSAPSFLSLMTTMSFIGCVAVAMTLVTISGNIMAFCFGTTAAASSVVFASMLPAGLLTAIVAALAFGAVITGLQGLIIGRLRANPIIVSIAALALIMGITQTITDARSVYIERGGVQDALKGKIAGIPFEFVVFLGVAAIGQFLLSYTPFGRNLYMVGSSTRAAEAAGIRVWRTTAGTYLWAGAFVAVPGMMLAIRYNTANMEYGVGYDYDAIAAVLVGGTPIHGGEGAVWRTIVGVVLIAVVQVLVLLHGVRQEWQYLITGLIVLFVIMLHTAEGRH
jgi:ribose/xylose/arabinose/galactoside ABC-type transport system permease subunit